MKTFVFRLLVTLIVLYALGVLAFAFLHYPADGRPEVGTIVHDFKNPLTIIGLAAELACSDDTTPPMRAKAQNKIARQVERMTNMLQELIEFTKPSGQKPHLTPVNFASYMNPLADERVSSFVRNRRGPWASR